MGENQRLEKDFLVRRALKATTGEAEELARSAAPVPGEDQALRDFRSHAEGTPPGARTASARTSSSRRLRTVAGLVVAAALVAIFLLRGSDEEGVVLPERGQALGSGEVLCANPRGAVTSFEGFEFRVGAWEEGGGESERGAVSLRVFDENYDEVLTKSNLTSSPWIPTPDELARLPQRIVWEAYYEEVSGELVDSDSAEAWLSSP